MFELTEQDRIQEQVDLDPWLSRQERVLTRQPDGSHVLRVYLDDLREIPFGEVRSVGCQVVYHCNDVFYPLGKVPPRPNPNPLPCELRGMKER